MVKGTKLDDTVNYFLNKTQGSFISLSFETLRSELVAEMEQKKFAAKLEDKPLTKEILEDYFFVIGYVEGRIKSGSGKEWSIIKPERENLSYLIIKGLENKFDKDCALFLGRLYGLEIDFEKGWNSYQKLKN